jgi:hypothetical protein
MVMRSLAALVLCVGSLACGAPAASPSRTVERYLDTLARDPIRSLTLVTDDFQRGHGMRFAEVGDAPPDSIHFEGAAEPAWGAAASAASADPTLELERARLGWLTTLTRRAYARQVPEISLEELVEEITGDRARVELRARYRGQTADVRFHLVRPAASGRWRIDAIEIADEAALAPSLPYLLAPNAERHRRLERALAR